MTEQRDLKKLMDVALGRCAADLAVVNARLVNVYTGEILDGQSVSVCGDRIAFVGPDAGHTIGRDTTVVDADGQTLIPGLIDGHTHIASLYTAANFAEHAACGGTTTIIAETLEPYPVAGIDGVLDFLASLKEQPIRFFATAPAMVSISPATKGIDTRDLERLLALPEVLGLGESYWQAVLQEPARYLPALAQTQAHGKLLEGHSAGARAAKLQAYAACGISSCHEPIRPQEVLERLRLGIYVMIREGSIRRDLAEIAAIKDMGVDTRRLILTTDGISPAELVDLGYMEYLVQKAIDCGFDPVAAVQMASLNVAEHFRLDDRVGGVAPGKFADFVLIPDPATIRARLVIGGGRIIARDGRLETPSRRHRFAAASMNSIHIPDPFSASDFHLPARKEAGKLSVRAIEMVTDLVTREALFDVSVSDGAVTADPEGDLVKVAAIERAREPGKCFTGLIKGFGLRRGAMATSLAWDSGCVIVIGANDGDMAVCLNRIRELQGGMVVCENGRVTAELATPVFGLISEAPMAELILEMRGLKDAVARLGVPFPDPFLSIGTLTCAAIPYLRICEAGLVNLKDGRLAGVLPESD